MTIYGVSKRGAHGYSNNEQIQESTYHSPLVPAISKYK
ncbi:MAG: hypothetical protein QOD75_670 [Blastocatellia bacterium]|jgi:hypothetical protein|nr:hypothetical protein [Blastocatellia bacterium]